MPKNEIARLMQGFRQFHEKFFEGKNSLYGSTLSKGQGPKTLIIGCSDSRVDPAIISSAGPGELFVVRNIANLVPPFEEGGGYHGVSSAIEFAVVNLKVEHVVVLGHRQCGGIRALVFPEELKADSFIHKWMSLAETAKARAIKKVGSGDSGALVRQCELEGIRNSLENLRSFPFVKDAIAERGLNLLGLYFDLEKGEMLELDEKTGNFSPVAV